MDAVLLALISAVLFGAMPVAVRFALVPPVVPAAVGALLMQVGTFAVLCVAAAIQGGITLDGAAPFLIAGAITPGLSNLFITVGIREAGSSRASIAFGMAPLFAVTIAVLVFDERPGTAVLFGALLIVCGGVALALEPERPRHVRRIGIAFALVGAALFALRDNLVRDESLETDVPSMTAGTVMLATSLVVTGSFVVARRHPVVWPARVVARWLLPGAFVGLSYVALFEAFYRGTVSVVAPIVATESLFGVLFSAILLHKSERVGARIVLGAALVVAGGGLSPSSASARPAEHGRRWVERPGWPLHPASSSMRGCEEVRVDVPRDLATEVGGLDIGGPEMDPCPDARFDDLVGHVGEAAERPLLAREPAARRIERHVVVPKKAANADMLALA